MGWKGTIRSIQASARAAERNAQRRQRELEKERQAVEKMEALQQATYEVEVYENYIDLIQSIHKEWSNLIDWESIKNAPEPIKPKQSNKNQKNFKAGIFTKLLGNEEKKKKIAIKKDDEEYKKKIEKWKADHSRWEDHKNIATKLLSEDGEPQTKLEVIEIVNPFKDMDEIGLSLTFTVSENNIVEATLHSHGEEIVPNEIKSLLQSGKLSVKKMPKGRFYEIYQDHICSAVLRIGSELLAMIPDDLVLVHVKDKLLNTATGHMEEQFVLSVAISRETISSLNMELIDPSDSLVNFVHNMDFKKTKGLGVVSALTPNDFSAKNIS